MMSILTRCRTVKGTRGAEEVWHEQMGNLWRFSGGGSWRRAQPSGLGWPNSTRSIRTPTRCFHHLTPRYGSGRTKAPPLVKVNLDPLVSRAWHTIRSKVTPEISTCMNRFETPTGFQAEVADVPRPSRLTRSWPRPRTGGCSTWRPGYC